MLDENITPTITSDYSLTPKLSYFGTKTRLELNGSCLRQDRITFTHGKIANIYIVYAINKNFPINSYATLENCLFGVVKLTKNADIDININTIIIIYNCYNYNYNINIIIIIISINILDMALDSIERESFQ